MEIEIVADVRAAIGRLDRIPPEIDRANRGAMEDSLSYLHRQLTTYPPQRTGSAYRRTGTLGRSWSWRIEGGGSDITGIVGSNANMTRTSDGESYNRLVQDRTMQARVHRGIWNNTAQTVAERSTRQVNDFFAARIRAALG